MPIYMAYFKFADADMHGNLKFVLNKPLNRKHVKHFRSEEDIINIISAYYEEDEFQSTLG